ncbi:fibronectin type III-like domain-contianing protein [Psychrosphaera sp. G1-22]|uniref:Fibronectin type III-like domain-contianing protein n=1 Tax=Psychrosphaera algicola TaxID=3023714 RepID=A0ABT5F9Y8_9GAMM|nr:fibronectin type III-like domain-contianing protein [Psychrosphaera sp. G1-22]MDC2888345.1 fibronectin type III-like domain-contianing protein [Psychrosphaera sp. G1-22]
MTLTLKPRDLSFWDESTNAWRYEAGEFEAFIGSSLADLRLNQRFVYQ